MPSIIYDQPRPTLHAYKGEKYMVRLNFDQYRQSSRIPIAGSIQFESSLEKIWPITPSNPWNDIEEAITEISQEANRIIDQRLETDRGL